jgi:hypothetical protein
MYVCGVGVGGEGGQPHAWPQPLHAAPHSAVGGAAEGRGCRRACRSRAAGAALRCSVGPGPGACRSSASASAAAHLSPRLAATKRRGHPPPPPPRHPPPSLPLRRSQAAAAAPKKKAAAGPAKDVPLDRRTAVELAKGLYATWQAPMDALSKAGKAFAGLEALLGGARDGSFDLQVGCAGAGGAGRLAPGSAAWRGLRPAGLKIKHVLLAPARRCTRGAWRVCARTRASPPPPPPHHAPSPSTPPRPGAGQHLEARRVGADGRAAQEAGGPQGAARPGALAGQVRGAGGAGGPEGRGRRRAAGHCAASCRPGHRRTGPSLGASALQESLQGAGAGVSSPGQALQEGGALARAAAPGPPAAGTPQVPPSPPSAKGGSAGALPTSPPPALPPAGAPAGARCAARPCSTWTSTAARACCAPCWRRRWAGRAPEPAHAQRHTARAAASQAPPPPPLPPPVCSSAAALGPHAPAPPPPAALHTAYAGS